MVPVGEDVCLAGQVGAARVHKVDAGQAAHLGNLLQPQMLLHGTGAAPLTRQAPAAKPDSMGMSACTSSPLFSGFVLRACLSDRCMWVHRDVSDKVHLDGDGVVCAALDSGIICYKGHQAPLHSAYARHNASRRHLLSSWRTDSANSIGKCNLP